MCDNSPSRSCVMKSDRFSSSRPLTLPIFFWYGLTMSPTRAPPASACRNLAPSLSPRRTVAAPKTLFIASDKMFGFWIISAASGKPRTFTRSSVSKNQPRPSSRFTTRRLGSLAAIASASILRRNGAPEPSLPIRMTTLKSSDPSSAIRKVLTTTSLVRSAIFFAMSAAATRSVS